MQKKSKSTQSKSSRKKKPMVQVRDLRPKKDVQGGRKIGDIKGESMD